MPDVATLRATWRSLEARGQLTLVASFAIVAVAGYMLYHYASRTSYTAVQTGVTPADANRASSALAAAGIPYKVTAGGTEVEVPSSRLSDASVALSAHGIGGGSQTGLEQVTKSSLGMTDLQQRVLYQEGLQGQLEQQIQGITDINSSQVTLVLPTDTLFKDQASQASAAVLVDTAEPLPSSEVTAIARMVAGGVQGLDPQNVTITDSTGALLWPQSGADGSLSAGSKLAAQQSYDAQLAAQLNAVIIQTLGPGKGTASVNADLNVDTTTTDSVTYTGPRTALTQNTTSERLTGQGANAGGPAGSASNVPPVYSGGSASGGKGSIYSNDSNSSTYDQDKTVTHTLVAPGSVKRLSVSVLLDSSVPAAQQAAIKKTVAAMVGYNAKRGDTLSLASTKFATTTPAGAHESGPLGLPLPVAPAELGRDAAVGLGCLIFLFLVRRSLRSRERDEIFAEPRWLTDIQTLAPIAQLEQTTDVTLPVSAEQERHELATRQMQEIVAQKPDQVAVQVAQWMNES